MIFLHTLGTAAIDAGDNRVMPTQPRKFALLLHLAAERGRRIPRRTLQDLVFPEKADNKARHSLRELVYQVRQLGVSIASDPDGLELLADEVDSDYAAVIQAERPTIDQLKAIERGFLPGYSPDHSEAFTVWLDGFRTQRGFELCKACVREMDRARTVADWVMMERAARACLVLDPLNELANVRLAEVLAIGGSKAKAVRLLEAYMEDVGRPELKLSAALVKRRIAERVPDGYSKQVALPLIGRESEMLSLRQAFDSARNQTASCVVLSGEPGIGKSRLASEFAAAAALDGACVQRVTMQPHDAGRPMSAFTELVPALLQLPGALGCSPESMTALHRLIEHQHKPVPLASGLEAELLSSAITRAIRDLCEAIASEAPLVLLIEDAHWLDVLSRRTIGAVASTRSHARILFVITTREPRPLVSDLRHAGGLHLIPLRKLDEVASRQVVDAALGSADGASQEVRENIIAASAGNPLFAISLAAHCRAMGNEFAIPAGMRDLLAARFDALSSRSLSILHTCITLGRHCTVDRLVRTLEVSYLDLMDAVGSLCDAHLVDLADDLIRPAHPLIAEVLHDRSSPVLTSVVNHKVAEVLQAEADQYQSPSLLWQAAELWLNTSNYSRAFRTLRACARHAMEIGRPSEAARILARACGLSVSDQDLVNAARELVRAADLGSDHGLVVHGMGLLRSRGRAPEHDDLELSDFRSTVTQMLGDATIENRLLCCLASEIASAEHRVKAATWLLKYADIVGKPALVHTARHRLEKHDLDAVSALVRLEFELVLHSALNENDLAASVARDLLREGAELPPVKRAIYENNAAVALWRAGYADAAVDAYERFYSSGNAMGSCRARLRAASQLAVITFDLERDGDAHAWVAKARAAVVDDPELQVEFEYMIAVLDIALTEREVELSEKLFAEAESFHAFDGSELRARWGAVVALELRLLKRQLNSADEATARALATNATGSMTGVRDAEVAVGCDVLLDRGHESDARSLLQRYLVHERRAANPLARRLRILCRRLSIEA